MNEAACIVYVVAFLALPPVLLMTRLVDKSRMPWALLLVMSVAVGWLLVNLAAMFYDNDLTLKIRAAAGEMSPSPDIPRNDFLFAFGWLLGPVYLVPWLFLYCVFVFVRWMSSGSSVRRR